MCHGPLESIFRVVEETLEENRVRHYDRSYEIPSEDTGPSIDAELARMYARGDIKRDTFLRLRPMARQGGLSWADLESLKRDARLHPLPRPAPVDETTAALTNIRDKKAALQQAASDSESVAQSLDQRIAGSANEAARLESQAREVLPKDENQARALLTTRQEILEGRAHLEERVSALRQDIQRLQDLKGELDVREQGLKVLQARERLGALEEEIKKGPQSKQEN